MPRLHPHCCSSARALPVLLTDKMWYRCGAGYAGQCYATSLDGIVWTKPMLDVVPGTNIILTDHIDGATVW